MKKIFLSLIFNLVALSLFAELTDDGYFGLDFTLGMQGSNALYSPRLDSPKVVTITIPTLGLIFRANEIFSCKFFVGFQQSWGVDGAKDTINIISCLLGVAPLFKVFSKAGLKFLAGPYLETGFVTGRNQKQDTGMVNTVYGITLSLGMVLGMEYFVLPNFSIGTSAPLMCSFPILITDVRQALYTPMVFAADFPQKVQLSFAYYFN